MWDLAPDRAFAFVKQTKSFVVMRAAIYGGAVVVAAAAMVGLSWWGASIFPATPAASTAFAVAGGVLVLGLLFHFRRRVVFATKAAHVAALVELVDGRELPAKQVAYARILVKTQFGKTQCGALHHAIVDGLRAVHGYATRSRTSVRGFKILFAIAHGVPRLARAYADEVIMALNLRARTSDPWRSSREGIIIYAQNYNRLTKSLFLLGCIHVVLALVSFVVCLVPAALVASLMPGELSMVATAVVSAGLAWVVCKALVEPVLMTCLLHAFTVAAADQKPKPGWGRRLDEMSFAFRGMTGHFVHSKPSQATSSQEFGEQTEQLTVAMLMPVAAPPPTPSSTVDLGWRDPTGWAKGKAASKPQA